MITKNGRWVVEDRATQADKLLQEFGPDHFEGPHGHARLPKQNGGI
jgi:hypothetical protein